MGIMKTGLAFAVISLVVTGAMGCASMQQPAPAAAAPAAPQFTTPAPEVRASVQFSGLLVQIYHPETRTLYLWSGDPRPKVKRPMQCFKLQLSDSQSGNPQRETCE
jgi:hypothetical protein